MSTGKKVCFTLIVCLVAVAAAEVVLSLISSGKREHKSWVSTSRGMAHCYTSDVNRYFPLDLRRSADLARMAKIFLAGLITPTSGPEENLNLEELKRRSPHCITYDRHTRAAGFHPGRARTVALVGDSFTFGEGLRDADTLGYLLGQRFRGANFRTLARAGAEIGDSNVQVAHALERFKVKNIIYFFNLNDVIATDALEEESRLYGRPEDHSPPVYWLVSRLSILRILDNVLSSRRTISAYRRRYFDASNRKQVEDTMGLLGHMAGVTRENGGSFLVVIYPNLYKNLWGYPFTSIHALIMDNCKKQKIRCVDGYGAFAGFRSLDRFRVHAADQHPNGLANRTLVEYLIRQGSIVLR